MRAPTLWVKIFYRPPLESFGFELYPLKGIVLQILVELTEPD